ncbi:MAG TPA: OmpA family protein [Saprospiraceae bacterium]|nr:OmpA family protein [Saprospiraceae bacterium]
MTRLIFLSLFFLFSYTFTLYSQEATSMTDEARKTLGSKEEQNEKWRMGEYKYSARPNDAWELGIHLGHFFISGDVNAVPGMGIGLHLRKAIHYNFSLRGELFFGQARGLDTQPRTRPSGGLVEAVYAPYEGVDGGWFASYRNRQANMTLQGVLNIGNMLFHKENNNWNLYTALGVGLSLTKTQLDLLGDNNQPYQNLINRVGYTESKHASRAGRKEIRSAIRDVYNGVYETDAPIKGGVFGLNNAGTLHFLATASLGISRKINQRWNLGIEHQIFYSNNDYLDGISFRAPRNPTNNRDLGQYTSLRVGINLGNFNKVTEPLYWLNPYDAIFNDIAELKRRPVFDLTDSDGDGVIDLLDQEPNTPEGCPVDTRGVMLDSDGDGIPDCKDAEPFSPPGYPVDSRGVAQVPPPFTEGDAITLIDARVSAAMENVRSEWFLPMIHFDLDRYNIKPEFRGNLHNVASVMKTYPDMCITIEGHTDTRSGEAYNNVLSYNRALAVVDFMVSHYGINRDRFRLMYGGKTTPLIDGSRYEAQHYMNRRVEMRVCQEGDRNMDRPQGPSAGRGESMSGIRQ